MPRTAIAPQAGIGSFPVLPIAADAADLSMVAADLANLNQAAYGSYARLMVVVQNSGASPYTVTFTSAPDALNRTGDISAYSLAAGDIAFFFFERNGWRQSDGNLYFQGSNAAVKFGVIGVN